MNGFFSRPSPCLPRNELSRQRLIQQKPDGQAHPRSFCPLSKVYAAGLRGGFAFAVLEGPAALSLAPLVKDCDGTGDRVFSLPRAAGGIALVVTT